jgi:4-diphosphocytidyl-2-C-methyl-D-erythritol kinase
MVTFPPAKINIGLYVTSRRDDGYHNISTVFYPIGLSDVLEVVPDPDNGPGSVSISLSGLKIDGSPDSNLVAKAYRLLDERHGLPGVKVYLHKCIPTGAGLGGGSSDGVSMLMLLNELADLRLSYCDLTRLALELGSDCPYFVDPVPSFAHGRGELLASAGVSLKGMWLMLFHPGTGISTGPAYAHVKVAEPPVAIERLIGQPVPDWRHTIGNVFEHYAFQQQPVIAEIKDKLYRAGAVYASMTGSGSAVYGLFSEETGVPEGIREYLIHQEKLII